MIKAFPATANELGGRRQVGTAQNRNYTSRLLLVVAALLVATQLRAAHWLENRFHQDEALYATFARLIASGPGRPGRRRFNRLSGMDLRRRRRKWKRPADGP